MHVLCGMCGCQRASPVAVAQVVELTEAARAFLVAAFQRADRDADGALSPSDCDELFSTAPAACAAAPCPLERCRVAAFVAVCLCALLKAHALLKAQALTCSSDAVAVPCWHSRA